MAPGWLAWWLRLADPQAASKRSKHSSAHHYHHANAGLAHDFWPKEIDPQDAQKSLIIPPVRALSLYSVG